MGVVVSDTYLFALIVFVWVWWCSTHVALCFSSSFVPCVVGFSGLFFFYCPSGIL